MRSEKEIREMGKITKRLLTEKYGEHLGNELEDKFVSIDWVLEGEPRYSIDEFRKAYNFFIEEHRESNKGVGYIEFSDCGTFIARIKYNPEKVKKILEKLE